MWDLDRNFAEVPQITDTPLDTVLIFSRMAQKEEWGKQKMEGEEHMKGPKTKKNTKTPKHKNTKTQAD